MKHQVKTLASNLKTDADVRSQTLSLVQEVGTAVGLLTGARFSNPKIERFLSQAALIYTASLAGRSLYEVIKRNAQVKEFFPDKKRFFVRVYKNDMLFGRIKTLVMASMVRVPQGHVDDLVMKSFEADDWDDISSSIKPLVESITPIKGTYVYTEIDQEPQAEFEIGGFMIPIRFEPPEPRPIPQGVMYKTDGRSPVAWEEPKSTRGTAGELKYAYESFVFECWNQEERDAVIQWLREAAPKAHHRNDENVGYRTTEAYIATATGDGNWSDVAIRTKETVILPEGEIETIVEEIKTFQKYESLYATLGVPYHHGIMLSGAPGTGKSSAAQAIASELGMTTYSASLTTLNDNDALLRFVRGINRNSVILLEDIDVAMAVQDRKDSDASKQTTGVTMEALLQVLDGISSPHGAIFILTTNHIEKIDKAIIRPGRIDATYDITYLVDEQFDRLVRKFCMLTPGTPLDLPSVEGLKITPAEIVGIIKKYIPNVEDSILEITDFVETARELSLTTA